MDALISSPNALKKNVQFFRFSEEGVPYWVGLRELTTKDISNTATTTTTTTTTFHSPKTTNSSKSTKNKTAYTLKTIDNGTEASSTTTTTTTTKSAAINNYAWTDGSAFRNSDIQWDIEEDFGGKRDGDGGGGGGGDGGGGGGRVFFCMRCSELKRSWNVNTLVEIKCT